MSAPARRLWINDRAERLFVILSAIVMLNGLVFLLNSAVARDTGDGSMAYQAVCTVIYGLAFAIAISRPAGVGRLMAANLPLVLFLAYVSLTVLWSVDPGVSLRRATALIGTTFLAGYAVLRFPLPELLRLYGWAFLVVAMAALAAGLLFPDLATHTSGRNAGAWNGIYSHKNDLGRAMTLGCLVFLLLLWQERWSKPVWWLGFLLCLALIGLSQSKTAYVVTATLLSLLGYIGVSRSFRLPVSVRWLGILAVVLSVAAIGAMTVLEDVTVLLGRDMTFTGRTSIWAEVMLQIQQRPWFGYGYRAFWASDASAVIYAHVGWDSFGHAHNGFLDLTVETGLVGLGFFLLLCLMLVRRGLAVMRSRPEPVFLLPLGLLVYLFGFGLSAHAFAEHGDLAWVLFCAALMYGALPLYRTVPLTFERAPS